MSITSMQFVCLFFVSIAIYYAVPKKYQWYALLGFSIYFVLASSALCTGIYIFFSIVITTWCARMIGKGQEQQDGKMAKRALVFGIVFHLGILGVLKYSHFFITIIQMLASVFHKNISISYPSLAAPIGISYYTMQIIGYLLDTYWGISKPQGSVWKTALFIGYYPQLISGPISRYREVDGQLYSGHEFDGKRVSFGLQRMLWGMFKKLVVSERLGILADAVYENISIYDGFYVWFAAAVFTMQLYTDFSGCMDIVLGASECYGIVLSENFRTPFFSKSVQEFWQRWHITLGAWMKDYILYPILRSNKFGRLAEWTKGHFGKKAAKRLPPYLGMLCVWILVGLWHGGGWKYMIGEGFWFWLCIVLAQVLEPFFCKVIDYMQIHTDCFSWHLFQSLRVFVLFTIGSMFFRLKSLRETFYVIGAGFSHWNPEIFFDGELYALGLDEKNFKLVFLCLFFLLCVSILQEKGSVRERLSNQNIVFQWLVMAGLVFAILVFGKYGPGYDAQAFIYQEF